MTTITLAGIDVTPQKITQRRFSGLIWGSPGCGKTTLAATAPGPLLWINFDPDGTIPLGDREDISVIDLSTEQSGIFEQLKRPDPMGIGKFLTSEEGEHIQTVVVDSLTMAQILATEQAVKQLPKATVENPTLQGYGFRNALMLQFLVNIIRETQKAKRHLIMLAHEDVPEKDKDGTVLYITTALGGKLSEKIPAPISEVWNMRDTGKERTLTIRPARLRKPMKTRMFLTNKDVEFTWKYDAEKPVDDKANNGKRISDWITAWQENEYKKIPLPK